jgi:glycosyltransferase involved in cell wall biosynthesis
MLKKGSQADLLISMHLTANTVSFLLHVFSRKKYICDMVDFAFDAYLASAPRPGLLRRISSKLIECLECRIIPKFSQEVIVVSELMKDILIGRYGIDGEKIHVLPEGIDPDVLELSSQRNEKKLDDLRENYLLTGKKVIMATGFFNWLDRADLLIEAFEQLKHRIPNLALVFAGDGDEYFRAAVAKVNDNDIIVTGWLPSRMDSYNTLQLADVCVITMEKRLATDAIYGSKLMDYITFKKPVVCFNLETLSKVVLGSRIGRVAQRTDAGELADRIADVLQDRSSIDDEAFERLINEFSQFRILASYAGIVEKTL